MGLPEVSTILWRERELLELLVYKLDAQRRLLGSGQERWLPQASDELEAVLDLLRHTELLRAIEVDALARELGVPPGPSLGELADQAPPPWDDLLRQHRAALLELAGEVRDHSVHNCEALARGAATVRELITTATTVGGPGRTDDEPSSGILLDQVL
jgi:hypothetical protein